MKGGRLFAWVWAEINQNGGYNLPRKNVNYNHQKCALCGFSFYSKEYVEK